MLTHLKLKQETLAHR